MRTKVCTKILIVFMVLVTFLSFCGVYGVFADETQKSNALFLDRVSLEKADGNYVFTFSFDKEVALQEMDITAEKASFFVVNRVSLADVEKIAVKYVNTGDSIKVQAMIPVDENIVREDGNDTLYLLAGFESDTGFVTTVRYIYTFRSVPSDGARVYKSDNIDDYEGVTVTSISVPEVQGSNFVFYIYFSAPITPRKYIDLQVRSLPDLLNYHGSRGDGKYSDAEIQLLYDYQIFSRDWADSLIYSILFGCESYNGLEAFPGNNGGDEYDMTPQEKIENIDLYTVYQIQEQVADSSLVYRTTAGEVVVNSGSMQPLAVQIHAEGNYLEFVLKGDSLRDGTVSQIMTSEGEDTGRTSFNENIAPGRSEKMALTIKEGLLLPNGTAVKADQSFYYDPVSKQWHAAGTQAGAVVPDETLNNQEGYTQEELDALAVSEDGGDESGDTENGEVSGGGCVSGIGAGTVGLGIALLLAGAGLVVCVRKSGKGGKEGKK